MVTGLDVTGTQIFTAWVHGDTHAERFGATRWACRNCHVTGGQPTQLRGS
jgi:hypothetical protein